MSRGIAEISGRLRLGPVPTSADVSAFLLTEERMTPDTLLISWSDENCVEVCSRENTAVHLATGKPALGKSSKLAQLSDKNT